MSHGLDTHTIRMERVRLREPALDNHTRAIPKATVTWRAESVELDLTPLQSCFRDRKREGLCGLALYLAREEMLIESSLSPRHSALNKLSGRKPVGKELALLQWFHSLVVVHVGAAQADEKAGQSQAQRKPWQTISTQGRKHGSAQSVIDNGNVGWVQLLQEALRFLSIEFRILRFNEQEKLIPGKG